MTAPFPADRTRRSIVQPVKRIHRVLSLGAAILWLSQALTGILIVFHWEIADAMVKGPAGPVDITALSRRIDSLPTDAGPDWSLVSVWTTAGQPGRFKVTLKNETTDESRTVRVAGDGTVLHQRAESEGWRNGGWVGKLVVIHHDLMAGDTGSWIVGTSGILLLTNLILGLRLAWPRARTWGRTLFPRGIRKGPARTYAWHRAIGLWLAAPALVSVTCGTLLVFNDGFGDAIGANAEAPKPKPSGAAASIGTDVAIRTALAQFRGASFVALYPPSSEKSWYDIRLRHPDELRRAYGKIEVLVDAGDGAVLRARDPITAPAPQQFMDALFPVHTGEALGLFGRLVVMLVGIGIVAMIVLGTRLWWLRRR